MAPTDPPTLRIDPAARPDRRARHALTIASSELRLLAYRQPYDLRRADQRAALEHTYRTEFGQVLLVDEMNVADNPVWYLVTVDQPVLIPEADVLPLVFGMALQAGGFDLARKVMYRVGMIP